MNTYYKTALEYAGTPYESGGMDKNGIDCSGLVNVSTGQAKRVWNTAAGAPPGHWDKLTLSKNGFDAFLSEVKEGDLLLWEGHCAFYAGGERLFHARKPGTVVGFTNDLKIYWLPQKGYPTVYRQIF